MTSSSRNWPLLIAFGVFLLLWPAYLFSSISPAGSQAGASSAFGQTKGILHYLVPSWLRRQPALAYRHTSPHPFSMHVTIVNCVSYHTEVLVGLVDLVKGTGHQLSVYANLSATGDGQNVAAGLSLLRQLHGDFPVYSCAVLSNSSHTPQTTDLAIYASAAEDAYGQQALFVASLVRLRASIMAAVIHNTANTDIIQSLMSCHPKVFMLGLARRNYQRLFRTIQALAARLGRPQPRSGWLVPFQTLAPVDACLKRKAPCRATFTVQGNMEPHRRDYTGLFRELQPFRQELEEAGVQVKLVGAATHNVADHIVPLDLQHLVKVHANYDYMRFYAELQSSIALVPLLGSVHYLDGTRVTSTLLSSFITGVPLLVDATFLEAYSFVPASAFYIQYPGEPVSRSMLRVAAMSADEHAHVRANLQAAIAALQRHNWDMLLQVMRVT